MPKEKRIQIDGIPITLSRSTKSRRVNITVKPIKGVRISVPSLVSFSRAERVAQDRIDWIRNAVQKMQKYEESITVFNEETNFSTKFHELVILRLSIDAVKTSVKSGKLIICFPIQAEIESEDNQAFIKTSIIKILRKEAKSFLPQRLSELAAIHNLKHEKISIRNAKTRWGSCSYHNNISLNIHLMRLPQHLIDYVILHELAHTVHKNHSQAFWTFLDQICPGAKKLDKSLKEFAIEFY